MKQKKLRVNGWKLANTLQFLSNHLMYGCWPQLVATGLSMAPIFALAAEANMISLYAAAAASLWCLAPLGIWLSSIFGYMLILEITSRFCEKVWTQEEAAFAVSSFFYALHKAAEWF